MSQYFRPYSWCIKYRNVKILKIRKVNNKPKTYDNNAEIYIKTVSTDEEKSKTYCKRANFLCQRLSLTRFVLLLSEVWTFCQYCPYQTCFLFCLTAKKKKLSPTTTNYSVRGCAWYLQQGSPLNTGLCCSVQTTGGTMMFFCRAIFQTYKYEKYERKEQHRNFIRARLRILGNFSRSVLV